MERKKSPLSKFFDVIDIMEDILCGGTLVCLLFVGLSQILCKHRNAVQIEQNLFKAEVAQAAAALFSK